MERRPFFRTGYGDEAIQRTGRPTFPWIAASAFGLLDDDSTRRRRTPRWRRVG